MAIIRPVLQSGADRALEIDRITDQQSVGRVALIVTAVRSSDLLQWRTVGKCGERSVIEIPATLVEIFTAGAVPLWGAQPVNVDALIAFQVAANVAVAL